MVPRLAFVAGWLVATLIHYPWSSSHRLRIETASLRDEVRQAREVVQELGGSKEVSDWELWRQKWLLRASLFFDLCLLAWIFWLRFKPPVRQLAITADTGGSSSDTDESSYGFEKGKVGVKGKGPWGNWGKSRPARPSDFKTGK